MGLIGIAIVALLSSASIGYLTIRLALRYKLGIDQCEASHKTHLHIVPRLGAIPVAGGLVIALRAFTLDGDEFDLDALFLAVTLLPALCIGLLEDFFQNLGTLVRLFTTMLSAALGWWLLGAKLTFLDIGFLDPILATYALAGFGVTLFAASGVSHAINIVDGCNGLSSFVSMVILAAIAAVANVVGDTFIFSVSILSAAAVLGFFVWNFPFGRLFLGDGGAYFTGLLVAELSIMLVCRNPGVSPWFPMLLAVYPIWETLYSAFRRMFVRGRSPGSPDRLHMHSLVYHRLIKSAANRNNPRLQSLQSSVAAMYMWAFALVAAVPALLFWDRPDLLKLMCGVFAVVYLVLYRNLVHFRSRRLLLLRGRIAPVLANTPG
ncbi:MAG: UDP-N-acetylmuramyl pentapeptide phosphotransferase/UDP-N-acetylglucosamine-phosphate transferase [Hydrocarboniphaga sp.]|uniref:MraY family glycosyltransferase n=1 Tax=Hydrocarboniphaga sp. TaxID=2033016 RepID=UPI0026076C04|nr:glycosyltransferase [Hydrocarboniphaga sp.]MDB5972523.1 UDP-N-acetylmuramyl pentapeptide phosphotransferase/UDP-N-acetylglucosamine-phosphate transferase [Hydrocarboniphaga sp.]